MDRSLLLRRVAVVFGTICLLLTSWYIFAAPKTLRVAVGPTDSPQHRFVLAMARALRETQQTYRLELVSVADGAAASKALDGRVVDLAVLRSDDPSSVEARSVAILQKRFVIVVTRRDSPVRSLGDVAGRPVALLAQGVESSLPLIERIMQHYGITKDLSIEELTVRDLGKSEKSYDAYIAVADPSSGPLRAMVDAIAEREKAELSFFGLPGADGLSLRLREVQKSTIPEGLFGGSPPKPTEELETVAMTYELTAGSQLSQSDATSLLSTLVDQRTRLRRLVPRTSFDVEPPPVDTPRRFLPHSGAAAYVNDEESQTFLETYSEQIWLGLFIFSIIGSSVAGFLGWAGFFDDPLSTGKLQRRIEALATQLSAPGGATDLEAAQRELDAIIAEAITTCGRSANGSEAELSLALWTNTLAAMLERKRMQSQATANP